MSTTTVNQLTLELETPAVYFTWNKRKLNNILHEITEYDYVCKTTRWKIHTKLLKDVEKVTFNLVSIIMHDSTILNSKY